MPYIFKQLRSSALVWMMMQRKVSKDGTSLEAKNSIETVGDKSHSTRSKEEIQKSNKVQTDKNNDQIRIMIISEV
jgi:hypothetical protein